MKKTRLFAAAAALGMFASVVSADVNVKPTTGTKTVTDIVLTVAEGESVVRAELGGKVVLPSYTVAGTQTTRSLKAPTGVTNPTCYVGWTSTVGKDTNGDGMVDTPFYTWNADGTADSFWYYDDGRTWSTDGEELHDGKTNAETWAEYLLLNGNRVLEPGKAAVSGYTIPGTHTNYASVEEAIKGLADKGIIEGVYSGETLIGYRTKKVENYDYDGTTNTGIVTDATWYEITIANVSDEVKKADKLGVAAEAILDLLAGYENWDSLLKSSFEPQQTATYNSTHDVAAADYAITPMYTDLTVKTTAATNVYLGDGTGKADSPVSVAADKNIVLTGSKTTAGVALTANGLTLSNKADNADAVTLSKNGAVIVVDADGVVKKVLVGTASDFRNETDDELYLYSTYLRKGYATVIHYSAIYGVEVLAEEKPATIKNAEPYALKYTVNASTGFIGFDQVEVTGYERTTTAVTISDLNDANDMIATSVYTLNTAKEGKVLANTRKVSGLGMYKVQTLANTSDKYVLDFYVGYDYDNEVFGLELNARTGKYTYGTTEIDAVVLKDAQGTKHYYPAFDTKEDLIAFAKEVAVYGVPTFDADTETWAGVHGGRDYNDHNMKTRTWIDGTANYNYAPKNGLDGWDAQQCTYVTAKGEAVAASDITVTSNAAEIDTTTPGIKELVITASTADGATATETVKVVIAPKYERTWKNGKVATLKAYHLNGNLYASYTYDWTAKKGKVTYFEADGETPAGTQEFAL